MCYCTRVIPVHYRTDDTCATVQVRHATTNRNTRALPTRGHARPPVHRADSRITNLCAHRSLCYSTRVRWLHVGTPAHLCTVYGRLVLNLRARAGRYTTLEKESCGTVPGSAKPDGGRFSTRSNGVVSVDRWTCVLYAIVRGWIYSSQSP